MAELLGIPVVTVARKIEANDNSVKIEQVLSDGYKVVESQLPCLVTVSPWCVRNFRDAVKEYGEDIEIYDISELVRKGV